MPLDTQRFAQLLLSELDIARQLSTVLQQELTALTSGQPEHLDSLNPAKEELLTALQQTAAERISFMNTHQLPHSHLCLERPELTSEKAIHNLWQDLGDQYTKNKACSERLSEVVLALRFRTQQKLKILHAQHNDPHLYNENGKTSGLTRGLRSVEA